MDSGRVLIGNRACSEVNFEVLNDARYKMDPSSESFGAMIDFSMLKGYKRGKALGASNPQNPTKPTRYELRMRGGPRTSSPRQSSRPMERGAQRRAH